LKLFLSSADCGNKNALDLMKKYQNKYYLYSYFNIRNKKDILDYLTVDGEIFIDSGAHTLQKPGKAVDWDRFVQEYIDFINKYKKYLDYIVELDVENKIGLKKVEEYRDKIWRETGIEPIVVWHRERGFDYLKMMIKKYKFIGFSGFVEANTGENEVPDKYVDVFLKMANDNGCKVHGFGYTRGDVYKRKFYSIDSSSWSAGHRFGQVSEFTGNRIRHKMRLRNYGKKYADIAENNIKEWIKYQKFLDKV